MNTVNDKKVVRQVVAVAASVFVVWMIYYGSYLPWQKSKNFIATLQAMGSMQSVQDVKDAFDVAFSIPSPIGQEEVVRHFSSVMLSTIQRFTPEQRPASIEIVKYVEDNFRPLVEDERGMSFGQNLFVLGSLNEVAFVQTKNPQYLTASEQYYSLGHTLAPRRPQFLYGLFDLYRIKGDTAKTTEVTNQILNYWPKDERNKKLFAEFLAKQGVSTTTRAK